MIVSAYCVVFHKKIMQKHANVDLYMYCITGKLLALQPPYRHIRGLLLSRTVNIWLVVQQYAHDVDDMYLPLQKVTYYYSAEVVHRRCA